MNWYKESVYVYMFKKAGIDWHSVARKLGVGIIGAGLGALLGYLGSLGFTNSSIQKAVQESGGDETKLVEALKMGPQSTTQESDQITPPAQAVGFNYDTFRERLSRFEGRRNRVYDDGTGVRTIGIGHAMGRTANDQFARRSRALFQQLFGNQVNWDNVFSGRAQLTNEQVNALADEDIDVHLRRARTMFPNLDTYPDYVQQALLDSTYRGDMGPRTAALINAGNWQAASDEYINRQDYRDAQQRGMSGIRTRMNQNRAAMQQYARTLAAMR